MHIFLEILGAAFAVALVIWRISIVIQAGKTVVTTTQQAKAALRRRGWRHRAAAHPLDAIEDPELIAAVILMASIRCDREITQENRNRMMAEIRRVFRVDRKQASDLAGEAEFLVRDISDYPRWVGRLGTALVPMCMPRGTRPGAGDGKDPRFRRRAVGAAPAAADPLSRRGEDRLSRSSRCRTPGGPAIPMAGQSALD